MSVCVCVCEKVSVCVYIGIRKPVMIVYLAHHVLWLLVKYFMCFYPFLFLSMHTHMVSEHLGAVNFSLVLFFVGRIPPCMACGNHNNLIQLEALLKLLTVLKLNCSISSI